MMGDLASDALLCAVRMLESQSRTHIRQATVEPLLSLVVSLSKSFRSSQGPGSGAAEGGDKLVLGQSVGQISQQHLQYLRSILCHGICKLARENENLARIMAGGGAGAGPKQQGMMDGYKDELLRLALCCSYGMLTIGLYADSIGDVLLSVAHLMTISMQMEEWLKEISTQQLPHQQGSSNNNNGVAAAVGAHELHDSPKKLSIMAKLEREKEKEKDRGKEQELDGDSWVISGGRPGSGSAGNNLAATGSGKVVVVNKVGTGKYVEESFDTSSRDDEESDFAKAGRGQWDRAIGLPAPVSAKKVILDKNAKSKVHVVKSRWHYDSTACYPPDESLTLGFAQMTGSFSSSSQPFQQTHVGTASATGDGNSKKATASQKYTKERNNLDERSSVSHPGRQSLTSSRTNPQSSSSSAVVVEGHRPITPKPLRDVIYGHCRIPKSVLNVVQECSSRLQMTTAGSASNVGSIRTLTKRSDGLDASAFVNSHVWTCGQNSYGELGHADVAQRKSFTKAQVLDGKSVVSIGAGNELSVFVTRQRQM